MFKTIVHFYVHYSVSVIKMILSPKEQSYIVRKYMRFTIWCKLYKLTQQRTITCKQRWHKHHENDEFRTVCAILTSKTVKTI